MGEQKAHELAPEKIKVGGQTGSNEDHPPSQDLRQGLGEQGGVFFGEDPDAQRVRDLDQKKGIFQPMTQKMVVLTNEQAFLRHVLHLSKVIACRWNQGKKACVHLIELG